MASYLGACVGGCARQLRSMTPFSEPPLCDSCRPRVEAEEARALKDIEEGAARVAAAEERRLAARAEDKKERADAAEKVAKAVKARAEAQAAVKEPPKRPGRFARK